MSTSPRYDRWTPGNGEATICWTCVDVKAILRNCVNGCAGMAQVLTAIEPEYAEPQFASTKKAA